ncbi:hypothetical protein NECAME_06460 [Necator americanus]|uniref:Uncharacterized protein n=1 Tax=Necator americanus TaxID=51031 RepID=W2TTA8_NECAM|nr:hypothetical protein NECAME_06460 [Necator americanus]ETN85300.1 hypothetical protein NECAME_06460 [Necator americanus]
MTQTTYEETRYLMEEREIRSGVGDKKKRRTDESKTLSKTAVNEQCKPLEPLRALTYGTKEGCSTVTGSPRNNCTVDGLKLHKENSLSPLKNPKMSMYKDTNECVALNCFAEQCTYVRFLVSSALTTREQLM